MFRLNKYLVIELEGEWKKLPKRGGEYYYNNIHFYNTPQNFPAYYCGI